MEYSSGFIARLKSSGFAPEAYFDQVSEHSGTVAQEDDFAPLLMSPADRHFGDFVSEVTGDDEAFKIESESVQFTSAKDIFCDIIAEKFETALGVIDASDGEELHGFVESSSEHFAVPGLADFESGFFEGAGANGDWNLVGDCGFEFCEFFDWRGEIGIGKEDEFGIGFDHSATDCVAFASVWRVGEERKFRVVLGEIFNHLVGIVLAAVADDGDRP